MQVVFGKRNESSSVVHKIVIDSCVLRVVHPHL